MMPGLYYRDRSFRERAAPFYSFYLREDQSCNLVVILLFRYLWLLV
jgi:hypothetical protein